jgi:putative transposase
MYQKHPVQHSATMFITTNTLQRGCVFADAAHAREAVEVLYRVKSLHPFSLFGFVVMPDHCHLLAYASLQNPISKIMNRFKMGVSHSLELGPIWQPRFDLVIPEKPESVLRYIHQNPVVAGLVNHEEDYPWSSASGKWKVEMLQAI